MLIKGLSHLCGQWRSNSLNQNWARSNKGRGRKVTDCEQMREMVDLGMNVKMEETHIVMTIPPGN